jgi:hypothetical protein
VAQAALAVAESRGLATEYLNVVGDVTAADVLRGVPEQGRARLDAALRRFSLTDIPPSTGPTATWRTPTRPSERRRAPRNW